MQDRIIQYLMGEGNVRVFAADSREMTEQARQIHDLSPTATAAMGRAMTAAGIMACDLKTGGSMTLNIRGDGPLGPMCVVSRPGVFVKAYAQNPQADVPPKSTGKLDVGTLVGQGRLSVIKDLQLKEPWMGQVNLHNGEIAEDLAYYYAISEQQPSLVALGVLVDKDRSVLSAGGIVVQPLPGCPDEIITQLEQDAARLGDISTKLRACSAGELVQEIFAALEPHQINELPLSYACDCSQGRIERALISLGREELTDMIEKDHAAEVSCHFCNKVYQLDEARLRTLLEQAQTKGE
ncbi:MAG: Hsp33 family molecular chaperone HslO [Eubacteriales bacterium]|nr:Hsp33 family molecular chaperone HslO [Eubacteriales bacterium]